MSGRRRSFGFLSDVWLVGGTSLLAIVVLSVMLWSPWSRQGIAGGTKLRLYCAAGMMKPVSKIIADYRKEYSVTVQPTYAGSGALLSTMRAAGGAGDLYLSADELNMRQARDAGLVAETIPVAVIRPVLVVHKRTQRALRAQGKPVTSAADLLRPDLKVVLADEARTSIGQATRRALAPTGLWAELEKRRKDGGARVSTAGTVNEVGVTVQAGADFIGVVWDAVAAQFKDLEIVEAPEFKGVSEHVMVGVLAGSKQPTAALQFARYLTARDRGMKVLVDHHFTPISDADVWEPRPKIHLAAGAMLRPGVIDVLKAFEKREGVTVQTSYNGCGVLVAQMRSIKAGQQPDNFPDAYFACDRPFLDEVQQWFDAGVAISQNDAVLIVPKGNPKKVESTRDDPLGALARPDLRVGLAHPKNSALGKLIDDLLRELNLHEKVYAEGWQNRVVHSEAAHTLVNWMLVGKDGGPLDVAVVYRSNVLSTPENAGRLEIIPIAHPGAHAVQPFAIASESQHRYLLRRLREAIVSGDSARHFRSLGFEWLYKEQGK